MLTDEMADRLLAKIPDHYVFPAGFRADNKALVAQYYLSVKLQNRNVCELSDYYLIPSM